MIISRLIFHRMIIFSDKSCK